MRKIIYFLILILNIPLSLLGQKVTLSGVVRDNNNGETLAGVYVMLRDTLRKFPQDLRSYGVLLTYRNRKDLRKR